MSKYPSDDVREGDVFGRWCVLGYGTFVYTNPAMVCECECGAFSLVMTNALVKGKSKSCGCGQVDFQRQRNTTHAATGTVEYTAWLGMKARCYYVKNPKYHRYGGRGIKVCKRWKESFESFLADMGNRPDGDYSLDRIDNEGDYSPENCRRATKAMQSNNKCDNHVVEAFGKKLTVTEWSIQTGINRGTLYSRLNKAKWSPEKALTVIPKK